MSGFVLLHRKLIGNPQFRGKDDEYAAIWLVVKAAWRDTVVPVGRQRVEVKRGECAFAVSYLAEAWGCSKSTAHNTLKHLTKTGFIKIRPERGYTRIFLMNYDTYQRPEDEPRTHPERKPERKLNANPNAKQGQARTRRDQNNDDNTDTYGDLLDYPERENEGTPNASPNANGTQPRTKNKKEITKKEKKEVVGGEIPKPARDEEPDGEARTTTTHQSDLEDDEMRMRQQVVAEVRKIPYAAVDGDPERDVDRWLHSGIGPGELLDLARDIRTDGGKYRDLVDKVQSLKPAKAVAKAASDDAGDAWKVLNYPLNHGQVGRQRRGELVKSGFLVQRGPRYEPGPMLERAKEAG